MPKKTATVPEAASALLSDEEVAHLQKRLRKLGCKKETPESIRKLAAKPDTGMLPSSYVHHWLRITR